ncbi:MULTISPECIES: hypothetical protein [Xanthomonas]|uniref:Glycine zipper domain-containing protein n=1 Tax=Xanthomonas rydalmerensis TaxID=3046274 RepID=A0ABZ0JNT6_9XANT|nr:MULTISPECIES: hypothetical protein [unclassified Xanthomonas]MBB5878682.1 hypothetical protein [Xanthomonas sp. 3498]MBB5944330.1 hypothetical protein [Xanthomonas sp. 3307]MXV05858.1 hypothetical protein [Xanthomonas sp. LMG 9002]WOS41071.1 hypothetical protein QN243_00855 [Xanthomonas sp. DM-2023]WOS45256.1 hypothetical protein QN242_00855 [Xanthomonas sp. DM-2023]
MHSNDESRDLNRDPISGTPGSHPVGVGIGGTAGGVAAGALAGTVFGPLGTLIGAAVGVVAGAAAGKGVAERIDPTGEDAYWREEYRNRDYVKADYDYDRDYAAAYGLGLQAREQDPSRSWEDHERELSHDWGTRRGDSRLEWDEARLAARDSWQRADATYRTYEDSDRYYADRFDTVDYRGTDSSYDDYRPAYRYGVQARSRYRDRVWDDRLESDLESGWERVKDRSRLSWAQAKAAVREAFDSDRYDRPGHGNPPDPRV